MGVIKYIITDGFLGKTVSVKKLSSFIYLFKLIKDIYYSKKYNAINNKEVSDNITYHQSVRADVPITENTILSLQSQMIGSIGKVEDSLTEEEFMDYCDNLYTCVTYLEQIKTNKNNDIKNS